MLAKTITYKDYDGNERTETHYFHLTRAELALMDLSEMGGLRKRMERMMELQDGPSILEVLKSTVKAAYGVKSPDGRKFIKNDDVYNDFAQTEAYSVFMMELLGKPGAAADFFKGILPEDIGREFDKELARVQSKNNVTALPPQ